jgi:hypothetical protein
MERENFKALIKAIDALFDTNEKLVTVYGLEDDTMFSDLAEDIFDVLVEEFDDEDDVLGDFIFTCDFGRLKDAPAPYRNADAVYDLLCTNMEKKGSGTTEKREVEDDPKTAYTGKVQMDNLEEFKEDFDYLMNEMDAFIAKWEQ